ncbi:nucleotidyltransferase family protein [Algirhabdus cladophorae]
MLFAAGFGSRMRPMTDVIPKPLVRVADQALLDHALELVTPDIADTCVINTHYFADQIQDHVRGKPIQLSYEPTLLDTGGGLKNALPLLPSASVFTLNTDAVWTGENPLAQLKDHWDPNRMDALLLLAAPEHAIGHKGNGDFLCDPNMQLSWGPGAVYLGAQIIKTSAVESIKDDVFSMRKVWDQLLNAGRLYGVIHAGQWCDVGYPEAIETAEALLADDRS